MLSLPKISWKLLLPSVLVSTSANCSFNLTYIGHIYVGCHLIPNKKAACFKYALFAHRNWFLYNMYSHLIIKVALNYIFSQEFLFSWYSQIILLIHKGWGTAYCLIHHDRRTCLLIHTCSILNDLDHSKNKLQTSQAFRLWGHFLKILARYCNSYLSQNHFIKHNFLKKKSLLFPFQLDSSRVRFIERERERDQNYASCFNPYSSQDNYTEELVEEYLAYRE